MATKVKLTEAKVRASEPGEYADTGEAGLYLYVTEAGKSWGWYRWHSTLRRPVRKSIGKWPLVTVDEARKRAKALSLKMLDGESIHRPDLVTLKDLTDKYVKWNRTRDLKYPDWIDATITASYGDWLSRDFRTVQRSEIADRHLEIASKRGRVAAARAVKALRTLYRFADENELGDGKNPAKSVKVEDTQPRRRFLTHAELARVRAALDDPSLAPWVKPYVLLAMLTGARRSNLAGARWADIDLDTGTLHVAPRHSKNKEPLAVVLRPEAVDVLKAWKEKVGDSPWVFPSPKAACGHLVEPYFAVQDVYRLAGIADATIHDLRRTLGSLLTQVGAPLSTVQRALGHKNPATTARTYSISSDASVREFMAKL